MGIDVDYGDTGELVTKPLIFCKSPNLRYDLKDISLYVTKADMASVVGYLNEAHQYSFVCWLRENNSWVQHTLSGEEVQQAVLSGQYLHVYASLSQLDVSELQFTSSKNEAAFWKRNEIVRISSPTHMRMGQAEGLLYYIQYSNEYVEHGTVVKKRASFRVTTEALHHRLSANFVSWRGKHCFDNASEHRRLFGDRFAKNGASEQ